MAKYYITRRDGTILAMDAVVSLSERFTSRPTTHPVANGDTVSDNIVQDLPKFQLEGVISGVAQPSRPTLIDISEVTQDYIDTITRGELVRFQSADRSYDICVLTDINFSKTSKEGVEGWQVRISLAKLNIVSALSFNLEDPNSLTPEQQKIKDQVEEARRAQEASLRKAEAEKLNRMLTETERLDLSAEEYFGSGFGGDR